MTLSPLQASAHLMHRNQQVRLLVPIETGNELEQLIPTIPSAQLVQVGVLSYVQLIVVSDARVAYRIGRTIQKLTRLPFELAYEKGHPQSDGQWLAQEHGKPPPLGITGQTSPRKAVPVRQEHGQSMAKASTASVDGSLASQLGGPITLQQADATPAGRESAAARNYELAVRLGVLTRSPVIDAGPEQSAHSSTTGQYQETRNTSRSIAITATPPVRPQNLATNAGLNYLFVRLESYEQLAALSRHAVVAEMGERNGKLLARVGVFTLTRTGHRLLNQQVSRLAAMDYTTEVIYMNT